MTTARRIIVTGYLPPRASRADRIAHMDADVRDVTARARAQIIEKARLDSVVGWELDDESWEMTVNGRTIITSAVMRRAL